VDAPVISAAPRLEGFDMKCLLGFTEIRPTNGLAPVE
jgi:hypothetical protein